jgi:hypothetical protein
VCLKATKSACKHVHSHLSCNLQIQKDLKIFVFWHVTLFRLADSTALVIWPDIGDSSFLCYFVNAATSSDLTDSNIPNSVSCVRIQPIIPGTQLHASFSAVIKSLPWAVHGAVQASFRETLPNEYRRELLLRHICWEVLLVTHSRVLLWRWQSLGRGSQNF